MSEPARHIALRYVARSGPLIALVAVGVWWGRGRDAGVVAITVGVVLGFAIVGGVVVGLIHTQRQVRGATPEWGWGGLASLDIASVATSPSLAGTAPRTGAVRAFALSEGTVNGRLTVGDEVTFRPGALGRGLGARPFQLPYDTLRELRVDGRHLEIALRDGGELHFTVVRPSGLPEAATRILR